MLQKVLITQSYLYCQEQIISLLERSGLDTGETSLYWIPCFLTATLDDGTIVGCIKHKASGSTFELDSLAVDEEYAGHGIATRMVQRKIKQARDMGYETVVARVDEKNKPAIAVLEKTGFGLVSKSSPLLYRIGTPDFMLPEKSYAPIQI